MRTRFRPPRVFGVLNVTPDSFSDGGRFADTEVAVEHGLRLAAEGADVIDVGGESTRPGAAAVDLDEERRRVLPVVAALVDAGLAVSVDTLHAATADAAIRAGATTVNDVSGGLADPAMLAVVAGGAVDYVAMHSRGPSGRAAAYRDVVQDVRRDLEERSAAVLKAGVLPEHLVLDPGLGFSKTGADNWVLLAHLDELVPAGTRLLVGASRKRFLAAVAAPLADRFDPSALARDLPTAVLSALLADAGVWGVRVHDVAATCAAVETARALREAGRIEA